MKYIRNINWCIKYIENTNYKWYTHSQKLDEAKNPQNTNIDDTLDSRNRTHVRDRIRIQPPPKQDTKKLSTF
jgi:hypothetical protein